MKSTHHKPAEAEAQPHAHGHVSAPATGPHAVSEKAAECHVEAGKEAEDLRRRLAEAEETLAQRQEEHLRLLAEFENARKRLAREQEEYVKYAHEKIVEELFPVLDSLEMTLSHASEEERKNHPIVAGVELILKQLLGALAKHGVAEVAGELEPFDPHCHEAIGAEDAPGTATGLVLKVHRKGYRLKDRTIRASLVTVSK